MPTIETLGPMVNGGNSYCSISVAALICGYDSRSFSTYDKKLKQKALHILLHSSNTKNVFIDIKGKNNVSQWGVPMENVRKNSLF